MAFVNSIYDIKSLAEELRGFWSARKRAMIKRWDYYYGDNQRYYLQKFEGETDEEYTNRVDSATIENHCAKTCDVLVSYLYGQPNAKSRVTLRVVDDENKISEEAQELLQDNIWKTNNIDSFRVDVALMASVTGCGIVYKEFVDKRTMLPFPPNARKEDKIKYGTIRYEIFDTTDTMPLPFISSTGMTYPRILGGIVRYFNMNNFSGISVLDRLLQKKYGEDEVLQWFDADSFKMVKIVSGSTVDTEKIETSKNPYNDINVPFTVFRNYGDPMYIEGISDLEQMIPLQDALNELMNSDKAAINYHSYPLLILGGGGKLPSNFIRKVNSALELDTGQEIKYLTWDNVLDASMAFKDNLRKQMTVVSGVSQISRGNATDIGQVRSGAGLKTLFQADINAVGLKIPHFREAEKRLALSTIRMWEVETGESFGEDLDVEVSFPSDFIGLDELLRAQVEQIDLKDGVRSIRDLVKEKHPHLDSEEEIDALVKRIMDEQKELAAAQKPPTPTGSASGGGKTQKPQSTQEKSDEQSV